MEAKTEPSYRSLLEALEDCEAVVAILFDSRLAALTDVLPHDPQLRSILLGETLVRLWLYQDRCPVELCQTAEKHFGKELLGQVESRAPNLEKIGTELDPFVRRHFVQRITDFRNADGIIPLICQSESEEAVALPFNLIRSNHDSSDILDKSGQQISGWSSSFAIVGEDITRGYKIVLGAELGKYGSALEGSSFGLPLALAAERKRGAAILGEFGPLDLVSSGGLSLGHLQPVNGVQAKAFLARRLGARFAVVSDDMSGDSENLHLPSNLPLKNGFERLAEFIDNCGIGRLTPEGVLGRLSKLDEGIRLGTERAESALSRLTRYEEILKSEDACGPRFDDGRLRARLLHAALLNHMGDAVSAKSIIDEVERMEVCANDPAAYVKASATHVVALTDMGETTAAEKHGRDLLEWINAGHLKGSAVDLVRSQMTAHGVLGGQPLLQKALTDESAIDESFDHLSKGLQHAEDLGDQREIAFDLVQIVLWRALFKPDSAEEAYQAASERLSQMAPENVGLSTEYLKAHRLLGAYRALVYGQPFPKESTEWELPNAGTSACDWLRASALKYRAITRGHHDDQAAAGRDFDEALCLMGFPLSPLLRFISGTIAAEACLTPGLPDASVFLQEALNRFESLPSDFCHRFRVSEWIKIVRDEKKRGGGTLITALRIGCRY